MDPLDVFMAEVQQEVEDQEVKPITVRLEKEIECDEISDPVAEYMEVIQEFLTIPQFTMVCFE